MHTVAALEWNDGTEWVDFRRLRGGRDSESKYKPSEAPHMYLRRISVEQGVHGRLPRRCVGGKGGIIGVVVAGYGAQKVKRRGAEACCVPRLKAAVKKWADDEQRER
jgi:hypothetical protein